MSEETRVILALLCGSFMIIFFVAYSFVLQEINKGNRKTITQLNDLSQYLYDNMKLINPNIKLPPKKVVSKGKGSSYIPSKDIDSVLGNSAQDIFD